MSSTVRISTVLAPVLARMRLIEIRFNSDENMEPLFDELRFEQTDVWEDVRFSEKSISPQAILERFSLDSQNEENRQEFLFEVVSACPHNWAVCALLWRLRHQFPERPFFHYTLDTIERKKEIEKLVLSFSDFREWNGRWQEALRAICFPRVCESFAELLEYLDDEGFAEDARDALFTEFVSTTYESARKRMQGGGPPRQVFLPLAYAVAESVDEERVQRFLDIPMRQLIYWKIQKFLRGQHELLEANTHGEYGGLNNLLPMASPTWLLETLPSIVYEESVNALARGEFGRVCFLLGSLRNHLPHDSIPSLDSLIKEAADKAERVLGRMDIAAELHYQRKDSESHDRLAALAKSCGQDRTLKLEFCGMS